MRESLWDSLKQATDSGTVHYVGKVWGAQSLSTPAGRSFATRGMGIEIPLG